MDSPVPWIAGISASSYHPPRPASRQCLFRRQCGESCAASGGSCAAETSNRSREPAPPQARTRQDRTAPPGVMPRSGAGSTPAGPHRAMPRGPPP
jgi:hypothetical protein